MPALFAPPSMPTTVLTTLLPTTSVLADSALALLLLLALACAPPVAVFALQMFAARAGHRRRPAPPGPRPTLAVLVPAHDEADGIGATLHSIRHQLGPADRLLVVADNCRDGTAAVARAAGAQTVERHDPRRGKGYALDFGVRHLAAAPPAVLVVIDADCLAHVGALDRLARACDACQRPVQGLYLMRARADGADMTRVAELAWLIKNWLRPLGSSRLGMPCQLMGSGMAFPWRLIAPAPLASAHLVEDLELGLHCAAMGRAPVFCPEALVSSVFPENPAGRTSQRARWEHGHLSLIGGRGLALLWTGLLRRDLHLLGMALDLCVPPLSLLLLMTAVAAACGIAGALSTGRALPWLLALAPLTVLGGALLAAWRQAGRALLPARRLAHVLFYVLAKLPLYAAFVVRRQMVWVASARDKR
ncbi:MAG: glycosyltransferase family 2 protein [Pseudomonadota bacterium]